MNIINLFVRSTNSKSFIPEIDGLRFFAIITVIIYHMNTAYLKQIGYTYEEWKNLVGVNQFSDLGWWIIRLDIGVKVFFAISGFILSLPFLKHILYNEKKVNLKDYFYRRLTRLEPPFIITLTLFYLVHVLVLNESSIKLMPNFLAGVFYSHLFIFGVPNPINPVTWSLETEAQFYIFLPFIFIVFLKLKKKLYKIGFILILIILSIYLKNYFNSNNYSHLESSILAYLTNFSVGVIFAWIYLKYASTYFIKKHYLFDFLGIFSIFIMFFFYKPQAYWLNNIILNLSIFGLIFSAFKGTISNWFYSRPIIYIIGGMCYSLYLLHFAFFFLVVKYTSLIIPFENYWFNFGIQVSLLLPLLLLFGSIFYLTIEKPCMDKNWPQNLIKYLRTIKH